jgi:hypothetical protein
MRYLTQGNRLFVFVSMQMHYCSFCWSAWQAGPTPKPGSAHFFVTLASMAEGGDAKVNVKVAEGFSLYVLWLYGCVAWSALRECG